MAAMAIFFWLLVALAAVFVYRAVVVVQQGFEYTIERFGRYTSAARPGFTRIMPQWRMGDRVRWQDKIGHFHRDLGDGNAEVTIANRAYRVRIGDLRPG